VRNRWAKWMAIMTPVAQENIHKIDTAGGIVALGRTLHRDPSARLEMEG